MAAAVEPPPISEDIMELKIEGFATYTNCTGGSELVGSKKGAGFMTDASRGRSGKGSPAVLFELFGPGTGWKYTNLLSCSACFCIWLMASVKYAAAFPNST